MLPTAYELIDSPPTKEQWKKEVKSKIHAHVQQQWKEDIASKSSLKYLNPEYVKVGKVHPVFATVRNNTYDTCRSKSKVVDGNLYTAV